MKRTPVFSDFMLWIAVCFAIGFAYPVRATPDRRLEANRDILALYREEIQQVTVKLKWRGERLSDDTVYAVALSGLSWLPAWNKEHPFWLGWGDMKKTPSRQRRNWEEQERLITQAEQFARDRDYREAIQFAIEHFTMDEIACTPRLKSVCGNSLLALERPEEAMLIYGAPFDSSRVSDSSRALDFAFREGAFESARRASSARPDRSDVKRQAIAYALSLLLDPGVPMGTIHQPALRYLESVGIDLERVLLGVLQAPERLKGLSAYYYAAADLLTIRTAPRLLPFWMHLAQSDDVHLRSRALLGLGILAFQPRAGDPPGWARGLLPVPLRSFGLSNGERKLIEQEIRQALQSDSYRLRAHATLALALLGSENDVPALQKMMQDRAYLLSPVTKGHSAKTRRIVYPVRVAAALGLARFGVQTIPVQGEFTGKELDRAKRGGQDVSNDRRNLHKESAGQIQITRLDTLLSEVQHAGQ